MSTLPIEKGHPMPKRPGGGRRRKYDWYAMKPGDSIFLPGKTCTTIGSVYSSARFAGVKITCWTEEGGARVWLVSHNTEATDE